MKKHIRRATTAVAAGLLIGFAGSAVLAQAPAAGGGAGGGGFGRGLGGAGVLDNQQRTALNEILQRDGDLLATLNSNLNTGLTELLKAALATNYDNTLVQQKAEAVAKTQAEILVLRARAIASVAPTFSSNQIDQLVNTTSGQLLLTGGTGFGSGLAAGGPALQQLLQNFGQGNVDPAALRQFIQDFRAGNVDRAALRQQIQEFMQGGGGEALRQNIQEFMQGGGGEALRQRIQELMQQRQGGGAGGNPNRRRGGGGGAGGAGGDGTR
jgi:hypothetical protein